MVAAVAARGVPGTVAVSSVSVECLDGICGDMATGGFVADVVVVVVGGGGGSGGGSSWV